MKLIIFIIICKLSYIFAREIESPPRIIKQPPSQEIFVSSYLPDEPLFIECAAIGEPPPKYKWFKNNQFFEWQVYDDRITQLPGQGTLVFSSFENADAGYYQCVAENNLGTAVSNSVSVQRATFNSFPNEEIEVEAIGKEDEPFNLKCDPPHGFPQPKIYWMTKFTDGKIQVINSSRITTDPTGNLWFSYLTQEDVSNDFIYICVAASLPLVYKLGNKRYLHVLIPNKPPLSTNFEPILQYVSPKIKQVVKGTTADLFCIFGGKPVPETKWLRNGEPIEYSERLIKANYGKSLVIKLVDINDTGTYVCEVSNGIGESKSYTINLEVLATPSFTEEPESVTVGENETAEFHCSAFGIPKPQIQWTFNGKPIEEVPPNEKRKVGVNKITINNLTKLDIGNYGCNASNYLGYIYKDVYVNVLAIAPEIVELSADKEIVTNQSITLNCKVFGVPKPIIKWLHHGREISSNDLPIIGITQKDAGPYTCFARNAYGEITRNVTLTVREHTQVQVISRNYETRVNTSTEIQCNVITDKNLDFKLTWLKDGRQLYNTTLIKLHNFSLTIKELKLNDSGIYTCIAKTRLDETEASIILTVQDVPAPPFINILKCNKQNIALSWIPTNDQGAPIIYYQIESSINSNLQIWETIADKIPASLKSFSISVHNSGTYSFRVRSWNQIGVSEPSSFKTCIINLSIPYKNPDIISAEGTQPNNLVLKWKPMPPDEHNGPGFFYTVYWKQNTSEENYNTEIITDWQQNELTITNQPSFQQYLVKVIANNALGKSNVTAVHVTGYSGEDVPEEAPTNFTLLNILSPTTVRLIWNPVTPNSIKGHFKGYKIITWTKNNCDTHISEIRPESTTAVIKNLLPYTKNYAQICVINNKYSGPSSEIISFNMPEGVPDTITSLDVRQLGPTALYLKWEKPEKSNGILTGYDIKYAILDSSVDSQTFITRNPPIIDSNQTQAKLASLKPNKTYRISVSATTSAGESEPYYTEHTLENITPSVPSVPDFQWQILKYDNRKNKFLVKVTWLPNFNNNPGSYFYVIFKKKGEKEYIKTPPEYNEDHIVIQGLPDQRVYKFALVAVDGDFETNSETKEIYFDANSESSHAIISQN